MLAIAAADESKPAEQIFHDIQKLQGVPAGRLPDIMVYFSQALGVTCAHRHVMDHWEKDTPAKQRARTMLAMVRTTLQKFYGGSGSLGCPTCHQGAVKPQFMAE